MAIRVRDIISQIAMEHELEIISRQGRTRQGTRRQISMVAAWPNSPSATLAAGCYGRPNLTRSKVRGKS